MSEHILKTIDDLEAEIKEHEEIILKRRMTINDLCAIAKIPPKYDLSDAMVATNGGASALSTIKPDQFYGKAQATAVREALNILKKAGRAPASVETIYELLLQGGYPFETKARESAIQGLGISIGKNSALFVKLNNGLIGVTDWYDSVPRSRRKKSNAEDDADAGESQQQTDSVKGAEEGGAS